MKIAVLGAGTWGFCLASLLAAKDYQVVCWGRHQSIINELREHGEHPSFRKKNCLGM